MTYFSLFGLLRKAEKSSAIETRGSTYTREFVRALDQFVDAFKAFERGELDSKPIPFATLVVDNSKMDGTLFEGLSPIGAMPWYFVGSPEYIDNVEARLRKRADELGSGFRFGRGILHCTKKEGDVYVPCTLEAYVRSDTPGHNYRLSALPPASAYTTYVPTSRAVKDAA